MNLAKPGYLRVLLMTLCFGLGFSLFAYSAYATEADCSMGGLMRAIEQSESSGREGICVQANNGSTCCGLFQFCNAERARYGLTTGTDSQGRTIMTSSRADQEAAMLAYTNDHIAELRRRGAFNYVGQTIGGVLVTESGIIGAAHLGGVGGAMRFLNGQGNASDGNTTVGQYMAKFAGYQTPAGGDGTQCGNQSRTDSASPMCDPTIRARVAEQVQAGVQMMADFKVTNSTMPRPISEVANTPCMSNELQRISNQFAYAPSMYAANILGQLNGLAGPVSGLMNNMLGSLFQSFTNAANMNPLANQFTQFAQTQISSVFTSLGLGGAFSSALCGMMVDMVLKYVQCVAPIKLPSLGQLKGSLNDLLPKGCAGAALTSALYAASNSSAVKSLAQPIILPQGGIFTPKPPSLGVAPGMQ